MTATLEGSRIWGLVVENYLTSLLREANGLLLRRFSEDDADADADADAEADDSEPLTISAQMTVSVADLNRAMSTQVVTFVG